MKRSTLPLLVVACIAVAGCRTIERTMRREHERQIREVVRAEVPVIVDESIGRLATRLMPWLLGPTGLLAGGGIIAARKRKNSQ